MNEIITEILSYAKAMWRYRWLSLIIAWAVSAVGWAGVVMLPDKFQSEARIYVDTGSLLAPLLRGIAVENNLDQEVTIMQRTLLSRPNLEQVMRMNDLDLTTTGPSEVEALLARLARDITITAQTKNLFSISYSHTNPRQAQSVVQSILTIFVENNLGQSRTDMESARGFIEKQIAEYEQQLQEAEQRRAEFKIKNGQFLVGGSYATKLEAGLNELRSAQVDLQDAEIRRDELNRQLTSIPERVQASDALQILASRQGGNTIEGRIAQAEQNLDNLKLQFTDKHPDVLSLQRLIAALKVQRDKEGPTGGGAASASNPLFENIKIMLIEAETNVASLHRRVTEAERMVEKDRQSAATAPRIEAELSDLDRDYTVLKGNYEQLLARRESARISQAQEATSSAVQYRVVDPPQLPVAATSPSRPLLYLLSLAAGLGAGGGIAFLLATLNDSFVTSAQLGKALGLPVLGKVSLLRSAAEELKIRRDYWKFGLASGSLMASLMVMVLLGPRLVTIAVKFADGSLLSFISGAA
ncbi:MAG: XrtA system polysaccharide chain length determinant [Alphaproteobacteria bacterium]